MYFKNLSKDTTYFADNIRLGRIVNRTLTEELDSSMIILTQVSNVNIEPYDLIEIENEFNNKEYWLVADASYSIVNYEQDLRDYQINLMSLTKLLECVQLPNMAITNIGQNRTISFYLNKIKTYFNEHFAKEEFYFNNVKKTGYTLNITNVPNNIVCPDCEFSQPTLREYLDYILNFIGCIAKVTFNNGVFNLEYLDLNTKTTRINTQWLDKLEGSISAQDYVTELDHTLNDVITNENSVEYVRFKSTENLLHSNNANIYLNRNIYDIEKVEIEGIKVKLPINSNYSDEKYPTDMGTSTANYGYLGLGYTKSELLTENLNDKFSYWAGDAINIDISNYVVNHNVFNSLPLKEQGKTHESIYNILNNMNTNSKDNAHNTSYFVKDIIAKNCLYQNNTLFFDRGSKSIGNALFYENKTLGFTNFYDDEAIKYAVYSTIIDNLKEIMDANTLLTEVIDNKTYYVRIAFELNGRDIPLPEINWANARLKITYKPYTNARLKLEQKDSFTHKVSMQDNSTNAKSDVNKFIDSSFEKNKQLGNDTLIMQATSDRQSIYYSVGQYYHTNSADYILNKLEYTIKQNSIMYKGTLTKNYSNRNINTVINREKRYYSLADTSESVLRNEVKVVDVNMLPIANPNVMTYWFYGNENGSLTGNNRKVFSGYIPCTVIRRDDMVILNGTFMDNIVAYTYVGSKSVISNNEGLIKNQGGYPMIEEKYVDSYGECTECYIGFGIVQDIENAVGHTINAINYVRENVDTISFNDILKDNREQLSFTIILRLRTN